MVSVPRGGQPRGARPRLGLQHPPGLDWEVLTRRGAEVSRFPSDPGFAERVLLRAPTGDAVYVQANIVPSAFARGEWSLWGEGPAPEALPQTLGLLEMNLDEWQLHAQPVGEKPRPVHPDRYRVWRTDDNGHSFEIGSYATVDAARRVASRLEATVHKQTYWVDETPRTTPPGIEGRPGWSEFFCLPSSAVLGE